MKKLILYILFCVTCLHTYSQINNNPLTKIKWDIGYTQPWGGAKPFPKSPVLPPKVPEATIEGNVISFISAHKDYTLTLLDKNGEVTYQATIPSTVSVAVLPSNLSGTFVLQLDYGGNFYFFCDVEL